jgi:hypothetical protein
LVVNVEASVFIAAPVAFAAFPACSAAPHRLLPANFMLDKIPVVAGMRNSLHG